MPDLDRYLERAVELGASDLHLTSNKPPMVRVDGTMTLLSEEAGPTAHEEMQRLVSEIMPERAVSELAQMLDTDFAYAIPALGRFRVNVFRNRIGTGAVLRHIPSEIRSFEQLGLGKAIADLCMLNKGLVLVTGPTGSGKSTTLAAMIDYINRKRREHIVTIEDPVEFVHEDQGCRITQREIKEHAQSFSRALRAALRQDPDIVMVGEMRDLETTEMAIETAETGHLVFGTLHTSTAVSTVDRVIDQFPENRQDQIRAMLATSLKGVIAQTLLKRTDGTGRIAAMEIMVVNRAISANIRERKTHMLSTAIQTGKRLGMQLLNEDLLRLVKARKIDPAEAYQKSMDKTDMANRLRAAGHGAAAPL